MSKLNKSLALEKFRFPNSRTLWHDKEISTPLLGCDNCHYRERCGGLQVQAQVFDCLGFCRCTDSAKCDNVCPKNVAHFVARLQEVQGLSLDNVPAAPKLPLVSLPSMVPMIYHSSARKRTPNIRVVALSLYEMFERSGEPRFTNRQSLVDRFKISNDAIIILSGTDVDRPLERWWKLPNKPKLASALAALGIKLVTSPNYSLFDDVPRHDNIYNMKRIAIVSSEIQQAGLHCAIHLNARTDRDWDEWIEYLKKRHEYEYVTFEFGTGAGARTRFPWHIEQLCRLAREVSRPLTLVVRGGLTALPQLGKAFYNVVLVDTASFIRAQYRRRGTNSDTGLVWEKSPTPEGEPIDDLLDHNFVAVDAHLQGLLGSDYRPLMQFSHSAHSTDDASNEPLKMRRLA